MSLPVKQIIADINHICETIGVRPPLSQEEYETVQFVQERLQGLERVSVSEQPFYSVGRMAARLGPSGLISALGLLLASNRRRWLRLLGLSLGGIAAWGANQIQHGHEAIWETVMPQRRSHNIVARIAPQKTLRHRVVLVARLDTDIVRLSGLPQWRTLFARPASNLEKLNIWASFIPATLGWSWLRRILAMAAITQSALLVADEAGPFVPGANANASGVALLLRLAQELSDHPLHHTEVLIAYTGCDSLGGRGMAELANEYGHAWRNAKWLVVESVGAGELCWLTDPAGATLHRFQPPLADRLTRVAATQPELGVMGRPLAIPDPARPLKSRQLNAVAVMGYARAEAFPAFWQSANDTVQHIDSATLEKTWWFLQAVLKHIDRETIPDAK